MIDNIYDTTISILKAEIDSKTTFKDSEYNMMKSLVSLLGEHEWNQWIQGHINWVEGENEKYDVKEEDKFGNFFQSLHKSMRQCDIYNLEISKDLGKLKDDEVEYWTEYAKKHGYILNGRWVGREEFKRKVYTLDYYHAAGYLDSLFYELVCSTMKVQFVMEYLWDIHTKGFKNYEEYEMSDDYFDMQKTKNNYGLTKKE